MTNRFKRWMLFILCCVLFVFSTYSTVVTMYKLQTKDYETNIFLSTQDSWINTYYVMDSLGLIDSDEGSLENNPDSSFYYEVIDNKTHEVIKIKEGYDHALSDQELDDIKVYNLETGENTGSTNYVFESKIQPLTFKTGWDKNDAFYVQSQTVNQQLVSHSSLVWGNLGWLILIIVWMSLLVTHYQSTTEGFVSTMWTEPLFISLALVVFAVIALIYAGLTMITIPSLIEYFNLILTFLITGALLVAIGINAGVMALITKLKTGTFFKNSLFGKGFSKLKIVVVSIPQQLQLMGLVFLLVIIHLFGITSRSIGFFVVVLVDLCVLYKLFKLNHERLIIQNHLQKIRQGEVVSALKEEEFSRLYRQSISDINNLYEGLEAAIEKSLQDERLSIDLITNVSHDLKTPLTTIINYTDFLLDDINPEQHDYYLQTIKEKSVRLAELAESVVEASKASSGKMDVELSSLNVLELLNQVLVDHQEAFISKQLVLLIDEDSMDYFVLADSQKLYRVYENLFKNIEKYAQENSRVYIEGSNNHEIIFKNVSKYQLGSKDLTARFVQGDSARQQEGSGLGLAISRDLMKLMNGNLKVEIDGDYFKVILTLKKDTL